MTKYIFGLLFLPGMFLYAVYKGQALELLTKKSTWIAALIVLGCVGGWIAFMDWRNPGFAERVIFYEMLHRYTTVIEEHAAPFGYFFSNLASSYFTPWIWLLPVPLAMLFSKAHREWRDLIVLLTLCSGIHLLIISFSKTKVPHYEVVTYPLIAMLAGIGVYMILKSLVQWWPQKEARPVVFGAAIIVVVVLLYRPYARVIGQVYNPVLTRDDYKYGYLFREIWQHHPDLKRFRLVAPVFEAQAVYYAGLSNRMYGYDISLEDFPRRVVPGDTIMVCNREQIDYLFKHFRLQGLASYEQCFVARVESRLPTSGVKEQQD